MIINISKFPTFAWLNDIIGFFYDVFMWLSNTLFLPWDDLFTSDMIIHNPFTFNLIRVGFKGVFDEDSDIFKLIKGAFDNIVDFFSEPLESIFGYNIDNVPVFIVLISTILIVVIFTSLIKAIIDIVT